MLDLDAIFDPNATPYWAHSGEVSRQQLKRGKATSGLPTKGKPCPQQEMSGQNPVLPPFPAFPANEPWNERQIREQVYLMADWLGYPAVVTETQDLISATARAWTDFIATAHINNVVAGWIQLEDIDIARGERVR